MGTIKEKLKTTNYNFFEKGIIYTAGFIGATAPLITTWYAIHEICKPQNLVEEIIPLTSSLLVNASSMLIKPRFPLSVYTGIAGLELGNWLAKKSKNKRENKKNLEKITK